VPQDVSVVGFDAIPLAAYLDPPLTTIHLPAFDLGVAAGRAILERSSGRPVKARTLLPTELIIRASTSPRANARRRID
jgi:LacI family transcriptional regulator